jgi:ABC-type uncharacterized transport system fused permease/ATPase subunit
MVTGENGAGKSSLLKILAGIWPATSQDGKVVQTLSRAVFYLPQKPYMTLGNLRDQVHPERQ